MDDRRYFVTRILPALFAAALSAGAGAQQPAAPGPASPATPGNALWAETVDEARVRAEKENKLVYVEFESPNCGQCRRMDALLYPALDFEQLMAGMVPVKIDLGAPMAAELTKRYGIQEAPAVLVTTPSGRSVFAMQGFENAPEFYREIYRAMQDHKSLERRLETQDINNLPPGEALQTGAELYNRSDPTAALPRLRRAAMAKDSPPATRDNAMELLARSQLELDQVTQAEQTLQKLVSSTKDPVRRERAALLLAQAPFAANRPEEGVRRLQQFLKDYPNSSEAPAVKEMLARLSAPPK
jgi:thioredoxin-like negative regulator of GroEL